MKSFGFDLLKKQIIHRVSADIEAVATESVGDSIIERLLFAALVLRLMYGRTEYDGVLLAENKEERERLLQIPQSKNALIVEPQCRVGAWRVDFLISAWCNGVVSHAGGHHRVDPRWRQLVVECDGHDFHERTKEQAAADRSRDRDLVSAGYEVFRFTGSELWRDPLKCADQVYDWAVSGL